MIVPSFKPEIEIAIKDDFSDSYFYFVAESSKHNIVAGGLRIGENVSLEEIRLLARSMSYKFDAFHLPVGGAKSGIKLAANTTFEERIAILRRFAKKMETYLRELYIIGEDLGSTANDIHVIFDELGEHPFVVAKGILLNTVMKSSILRIPDIIIRNFFPDYSDVGLKLSCEIMGKIISDVRAKANIQVATISILGLGSIGLNTLRALPQRDFKIIRIADKKTALELHRGFSIDQLTLCVNSQGEIDTEKLLALCDCKVIDHCKVIEDEVDFLIPAASQNQIHENNFRNINCKYIFEAANICMPYDIEEALHQRGIKVIPDFLFNSGTSCSFGLLVSNRVNAFSIRNQRSVTKRIMLETFQKYWHASDTENRCMRVIYFNSHNH